MLSEKQTGFDGFVIPTAGGTAEHICVDCGEITDWTADETCHRKLGVRPGIPTGSASLRLTELVALPERWLAAGFFLG